MKELNQVAQGSPDFASIVKFMSSGPIVALALTCENGVASWLDLLGPEDCSKPNSLRAKFGTDAIRNAAHGSASPAAAYRELKLFFPKTLPRELTVALVDQGVRKSLPAFGQLLLRKVWFDILVPLNHRHGHLEPWAIGGLVHSH